MCRVEEAAEWLGLGRTKAYELVYRGVLPSVTIGRSVACHSRRCKRLSKG